MSVIMAREGVSFVSTGLVENTCIQGKAARGDGKGLWKHGPCCSEQEECEKKGRSQFAGSLIATVNK